MARTAADRAFNSKLKTAVTDHDWEKVVEIFNHYGHYLQLVEEESTEDCVDAVPTST